MTALLRRTTYPITATSSVEGVHATSTVLDVTPESVVAGAVGAFASKPFRATSSRSNDASAFDASGWWSSTAMVLSPFANSVAGTWNSKKVVSSFPDTNPLAGVVALIGPAGRLSRTTSTPLTYTAAPSSRFRRTVKVWYWLGFETLMCLTKYCVIVPLGRSVASSPSPQPNSAGPVGHDDRVEAGIAPGRAQVLAVGPVGPGGAAVQQGGDGQRWR